MFWFFNEVCGEGFRRRQLINFGSNGEILPKWIADTGNIELLSADHAMEALDLSPEYLENSSEKVGEYSRGIFRPKLERIPCLDWKNN
jgi:hypothetical protein